MKLGWPWFLVDEPLGNDSGDVDETDGVMSFDLIAWKEPSVTSEEEASSLVHRFNDSGDPSMFHASKDVVSFYDELLQRCPALESFDDDNRRASESPWSVTPERSD